MRRKIDIHIGDKFERLTVTAVTDKQIKGSQIFECQCSCGTKLEVAGYNLVSGNTTSCGCKRTESNKARATHNMAGTDTYQYWGDLVKRSRKQAIELDTKWLNFNVFLQDVGVRPQSYVLGRLDITQGYKKGNAVWMPRNEVEYVTPRSVLIKHNGVTHTIKRWSELLNISIVRVTAYYKTFNNIEGIEEYDFSAKRSSQTKKNHNIKQQKPLVKPWRQTKIKKKKVSLKKQGRPKRKNRYFTNGEVTKILLENTGNYCIIDTEDIKKVRKFFWRESAYGYVETHTGPHGKAKRIFMHRLLMGTHGKEWTSTQTDHVNRNRLDNRKVNLRACTNAQNQINRGLRKDNTTGFTGVYQEGNRWYVTIAGQRIHGTYDTYEEAVTVRKQLEVQVYQEFSKYYTEKQNDDKPKPTNGHEKRIYQYQDKMWTISELESTLNINHKTISKYYKQGLSIEEIVQKIKAK